MGQIQSRIVTISIISEDRHDCSSLIKYYKCYQQSQTLIIFVIINYMRRRRGALHSNDEEEYIKLSILSEKNIGLFYNQTSILPNQNQNEQTLWEQFNYSPEDKMRLEEIEEEEKQKGKVVTFNVMVLYSSAEGLSNFIKQSLSIALDLPKADFESNNHLQLMIKSQKMKGVELVVKFWLTTLEYHTMLESYYKRAQMFILLGGQEDEQPLTQAIETVRNLKGQKQYEQKLLRTAERNQKQLIQELRNVWTCLRMCITR